MCEHCKIDIFEFGAITQDANQLFEFLFNHNILSRTLICPTCHTVLYADTENECFKCQKYYDSRENKKKAKENDVNFSEAFTKELGSKIPNWS